MSVVDLPTRSKQFHVRVDYFHARGDSKVSAKDSALVVIPRFWINDQMVSDDVATLTNDGPFLTIRLEVPEDHPLIPEEMNKSNREFHEREISGIRDGLTPEDWLEGTTDEVLILPVSTIEFVSE